MKANLIPFGIVALLAAIASGTLLDSAQSRPFFHTQLNPHIRQRIELHEPLRIPVDTIRPSCPDPFAHRIGYSLLRRFEQPTEGRVRIVGSIRNGSGVAYESGSNQQTIYLYQGNTLVARRAFQNLGPGQEARLVFDRVWSSSTEFPPTFRLAIAYDPDIRLDGQPLNDDCNLANNQIELNGFEINSLF